MTDSNSSAMLGQAKGVNANLASLISVLRGLFPLSAFSGSFTMASTETKTITDANCKANSLIVLQASNSSAGALEGSANHLYPVAANGSFTVTTASAGNAAGTENYVYLIVNVG